MEITKLVFVGIAGYLLGSINTSIIIGKLNGIDIRQHGSGNAGATNTLRTLGKKATIFVTLGDVLKGIVACLLGLYISGNVGPMGNIGLMVGGIAAIIGHNWPVYFGFKGGKGVLTSLAVAMMMDWKMALIMLGVFIVIVLLTKYISLGSIVGAALFPVFGLLFHKGTAFVTFASIFAILIIIRHHANIKRLLIGTENKFGAKKGG